MYRPVFAQPPGSWREWWSAVREFAAGWYGIPAGTVTGHHPDIDSVQRQLGVPFSPHLQLELDLSPLPSLRQLDLPPSLHEWAAFVADLQQAGAWVLRDRPTLGWDAAIGAVTLLTLSEGDVLWGVRRGHLADEDPPVDAWRLADDGQSWDWWYQHTPTTSQFALQHLIGYLNGAGGFHVDVPPSAGLAEQLRSTGQTSIKLGDQVLIEDDDLIVLAGKSPWAVDELAEETNITVEVKIGPGRIGSIPPLLVDLARRIPRVGGMHYGAFSSLLRQ